MKKTITAIVAASAALTFSSCQPQNHAQANAGTGAAIGALAGGVLGNQSGRAVEGAALGAALGGAGGYMIGSQKDKAEQQNNYR